MIPFLVFLFFFVFLGCLVCFADQKLFSKAFALLF